MIFRLRALSASSSCRSLAAPAPIIISLALLGSPTTALFYRAITFCFISNLIALFRCSGRQYACWFDRQLPASSASQLLFDYIFDETVRLFMPGCQGDDPGGRLQRVSFSPDAEEFNRHR